VFGLVRVFTIVFGGVSGVFGLCSGTVRVMFGYRSGPVFWAIFGYAPKSRTNGYLVYQKRYDNMIKPADFGRKLSTPRDMRGVNVYLSFFMLGFVSALLVRGLVGTLPAGIADAFFL